MELQYNKKASPFSDDALAELDKVIASNREAQKAQELASQPEPEERGVGGTFTSSLARGIDQTQAGLYGGAALLAQGVGATGVRDKMLEGYQSNMDEAALNAPEVGSISNINSAGTLGTWAVEAAGELAPSIATMFATGGAGGILAGSSKVIGEKVATKFLTKRVGTLVAGGLSEELAKKAAVKELGRLGGAWAGSSAMEAGHMYGTDVEERGVDNANAASAALLGGISGATDVMLGGEGKLIRGIAGKFGSKVAGKLEGKLAAEMLKGAGREFGQEALQEFLAVTNEAINEHGAANESYGDIAMRLTDAGAKGAIGGMGFGAVGHVAGNGGPNVDPAQTKADVASLTGIDEAQLLAQWEAEYNAQDQARAQAENGELKKMSAEDISSILQQHMANRQASDDRIRTPEGRQAIIDETFGVDRSAGIDKSASINGQVSARNGVRDRQAMIDNQMSDAEVAQADAQNAPLGTTPITQTLGQGLTALGTIKPVTNDVAQPNVSREPMPADGALEQEWNAAEQQRDQANVDRSDASFDAEMAARRDEIIAESRKARGTALEQKLNDKIKRKRAGLKPDSTLTGAEIDAVLMSAREAGLAEELKDKEIAQLAEQTKDESNGDVEWMNSWFDVLEISKKQRDTERKATPYEQKTLSDDGEMNAWVDTLGEAGKQVAVKKETAARDKAADWSDPNAWREYRELRRRKGRALTEAEEAEFAASVEGADSGVLRNQQSENTQTPAAAVDVGGGVQSPVLSTAPNAPTSSPAPVSATPAQNPTQVTAPVSAPVQPVTERVVEPVQTPMEKVVSKVKGKRVKVQAPQPAPVSEVVSGVETAPVNTKSGDPEYNTRRKTHLDTDGYLQSTESLTEQEVGLRTQLLSELATKNYKDKAQAMRSVNRSKLFTKTEAMALETAYDAEYDMSLDYNSKFMSNQIAAKAGISLETVQRYEGEITPESVAETKPTPKRIKVSEPPVTSTPPTPVVPKVAETKAKVEAKRKSTKTKAEPSTSKEQMLRDVLRKRGFAVHSSSEKAQQTEAAPQPTQRRDSLDLDYMSDESAIGNTMGAHSERQLSSDDGEYFSKVPNDKAKGEGKPKPSKAKEVNDKLKEKKASKGRGNGKADPDKRAADSKDSKSQKEAKTVKESTTEKATTPVKPTEAERVKSISDSLTTQAQLVFGKDAKITALESGNIIAVLKNGSAILVRQQDVIITPDGGKAYGSWLDESMVAEKYGTKINRGGIVTLAKYQQDTTALHESFHAAMSLALSPLERKVILKRYGNEEKAAEAYENWSPTKQPGGLFAKIHTIFKAIAGMFSDQTSPDDVFNKVRKGEAWSKQTTKTENKKGGAGAEARASSSVLLDNDVKHSKVDSGYTNNQIDSIISDLIRDGYIKGVSNEEGLSDGRRKRGPESNTSKDIQSGIGRERYVAETLGRYRKAKAQTAGRGSTGAVSTAYRGGSRGNDVLNGYDVSVVEWNIEGDDAKIFNALDYSTPKMYELSGDKSAKAFHKAISSVKAANKYGACVHVYDVEEYSGMRLFITRDAKAGFALKGNDLVSAFSDGVTHKGFAVPMLHFGIEQGGRRMDAFDTVLPGIYSIGGFKVVARMKWNDEYAPDGWDKSLFKGFKNGEPDVVFLAYDPNRATLYDQKEGGYTDNYDLAVQSQDNYIKSRIDGIQYSIASFDDMIADNPDAAEALAKIMGVRGDSPRTIAHNTVNDMLRGEMTGFDGYKETFLSKFREGTFDVLDRIKTLENMYNEKMGKTGNEAYWTNRLATSVDSVLSSFLQHGPVTWKNGVSTVSSIDEGFLPIAKELGGELHYWLTSRVVARAEKLKSLGKENLLTDKDIADLKVVADKHRSENKEAFARADRKYEELQKSVLKFATDSGIISQESVDIFHSPEYIPFYRLIEDQWGANKDTVFMPGGIEIKNGIKKLSGGEGKLDDPLTNVVKNWSILVTQAMRNNARARTVNMAMELSKDMSNPYITKVSKEQKGHNNVLNVMENGNNNYYMIHDKALFQAMDDSLIYADRNVMWKAANKAKRLLTLGATAVPAFRVKNFIRDTIQNVVFNKSVTFKDVFEGLHKAMTEHPEYIALRAAGGAFSHGYLHGSDPKSVHSYIEELVVKDGNKVWQKTKGGFKGMWDKWQKIGDAAENANRVALYSRLIKEGKSEMEAAYEAKDLLDFSMRGGSKALNDLTYVIPFLNARIAGMYKLGRAVSKRNENGELEVARMATLLAGASLGLLAYNMTANKDEWDDLQNHERWNYYHMWVPNGEGGKTHIRMPKPFELGAIFSSLPEVIAEGVFGKEDAKYLYDFVAFTTKNTLSMDLKPQIIKPFAEDWANRDGFTDRQIIPFGMEYLTPTLQFTEHTPETIKAFCKMVESIDGDMAPDIIKSPARFEHLVRGYFSSLGSMTVFTADLMGRTFGVYPSKPIGVADFSATLIKDDSIATTRKVEQFYDLAAEVETYTYTLSALKKAGDKEAVRDYMEEHLRERQLKGPLSKARSALSQIRAQRMVLMNNTSLSSEEKYKRLQVLVEKRNKIAGNVITKEKELY